MASAFQCRSCRQRINVSPQMGQTIVCPMCKTEQTIDLPGFRPAADEPDVPVEATPVVRPASEDPKPSFAQQAPVATGDALRSFPAEDGGVRRFNEPPGTPGPEGESSGLLLTIGCFVVVACLFAILGVGLYLLFAG